MNKRKLLSGIIILGLLLIFFVFSQGSGEMDLAVRYSSPSSLHPFGTDAYGRDIMERLSRGALISLGLGLAVSAASTAIGLVFAAFFFERGPVGRCAWIMSDTMKSIPAILMALFLSALFGPGMWVVFLSLTVANVPNIARASYLKLMVLRREEYVLSAETMGMGKAKLFIKHMLPHFSGELLSQSAGIFSSSILTEASLSFLGCGIPLSLPSIGSIMNEGRAVILTSPHMVVFPSLVLILMGIALFLIQDGSDPDSVPQ